MIESYDGDDRRLRVHDLRHTDISLWIMNGVDALEVADRAGHAAVATVFDIYGKLLASQDQTAVDRLIDL